MPSSHVSVHVHAVFSTKERYPFIGKSWRSRLHEYLGGCIRALGAIPIEVGGVEDHVHFIAGLRAKHAIADLMRDVKKASSAWVGDELRISKFHWQDGYGAFSVCRDHVDAVAAYIRRQEEHHRRVTFQEEYRAFLEEFDVAFDERYL
ncbi:MAG: transposase, partial [Thermoanaerobaculia bacterium]